MLAWHIAVHSSSFQNEMLVLWTGVRLSTRMQEKWTFHLHMLLSEKWELNFTDGQSVDILTLVPSLIRIREGRVYSLSILREECTTGEIVSRSEYCNRWHITSICPTVIGMLDHCA